MVAGTFSPEPQYFEHVVETDQIEGELFARPAMTMLERRTRLNGTKMNSVHLNLVNQDTLSRG